MNELRTPRRATDSATSPERRQFSHFGPVVPVLNCPFPFFSNKVTDRDVPISDTSSVAATVSALPDRRARSEKGRAGYFSFPAPVRIPLLRG
jgi:hypothetical protein